ncbi:MAG: DUF2846 domain-containing protein [Terriglobales bacterium]|jgi:hypothetical protein
MIKMTVLALVTIFLFPSGMVATMFAQNSAQNAIAPGCGPAHARFNVRTETGPHPAQPEAGKALVYFIQDDSDFNSRPRPTSRMGVDGAWVGATKSNSYFYFSVDPGVHHICAGWQMTEGEPTNHNTAAAHFTAEANGVYYFEAKDTLGYGGSASIDLKPLDSDEGQLLVDQLSFSISQPKK